MKTLPSLAIAFLLFFNCSKDVDVQTEEIEPLTDVLTLELTFGDEKTITKDEYLLAIPTDIAVNDEGDIYVNDEKRIKIFDKNGIEKAIFGGPGEGPGEFGRPNLVMVMYLGPTNYLTVRHSRFYNVFKPDYSHSHMTNFEFSNTRQAIINEHDLTRMNQWKIISINENERVFHGVGSTDSEKGYFILVHEQDEIVTTLAKYERNNLPIVMGELFWEILPGNKLIYTYSSTDKITDDMNNSFYVLHISNCDGSFKREIRQKYRPVAVPDAVIKNYDDQFNKDISNMRVPQEMLAEYKRSHKETMKRLKSERSYPPLKDLLVDMKYIFAFTRLTNAQGEIFTDVIDADSGERINSVYFPFIPSVIKNSCAYRRTKNDEGFFVIEKYKIHPAVYGK